MQIATIRTNVQGSIKFKLNSQKYKLTYLCIFYLSLFFYSNKDSLIAELQTVINQYLIVFE